MSLGCHCWCLDLSENKKCGRIHSVPFIRPYCQLPQEFLSQSRPGLEGYHKSEQFEDLPVVPAGPEGSSYHYVRILDLEGSATQKSLVKWSVMEKRFPDG